MSGFGAFFFSHFGTVVMRLGCTGNSKTHAVGIKFSVLGVSSHWVWDGGIGAAVDVLKGVHRQLLHVRQIGNVHRHSGKKNHNHTFRSPI